MRIIAGALKGCRLDSPRWEGLRPTSDKLRETLFNVLAPRVGGARVFDGYAGTGALGIEALSRGASHVTFVEHNHLARKLIASNLARCGITEGYVIIGTTVLHAIDTLKRQRPSGTFEPFEIVLLDPPYAGPRAATRHVSAVSSGVTGDTHDVLQSVGALVAANGVVVLEHDAKHSAPAAPGTLRRARVLVSGDSALTFYSCQL